MATRPVGKKNAANQRTSIFDAEVKKTNVSRNSVLSSLRATQIVSHKPKLPAELISVVLDYVPPSDLIRCAQVSRKLKEMVYDESRWISKLQGIGVWDEQEARQRHEEAMRKKLEAQNGRAGQMRNAGPHTNGSVNGLAGGGISATSNMTLFDIDAETPKSRERSNTHRKRPSLADGFDDLTLSSSPGATQNLSAQNARAVDVLQKAQSNRGQARQQYGKIHAALNSFYADVTKPNDSVDPMVFRVFNEPAQQAHVLANLRRYGHIDVGLGWQQRSEKLEYVTDLFQNRIANDFRQAYEDRDPDKMHRYVVVLVILDGGQTAVDAFIDNHPLVIGTQKLANPLDCIDGVAFGHVDLSPSQRFFQRLAVVFSEQSALIDQVFPPSLDAMEAFLERLSTKVVQEFIDTIFRATRERGRETFLKAVPGVFEQCMRFSLSLQPTKASAKTFPQDSQAILLKCFEPHVDLYFAEELDNFKSKAEDEVALWERTMSEHESQAESFFMSNVNRQAAKRDFLSSFKKVVMMPVNAVAAFPLPGTGSSNKTNAQLTADGEKASHPSTPSLTTSPFAQQSHTPTGEAPTTELAAKAALMNSRLEGIKSLFSIEVALNLVHHTKTSIERVAFFARHGDMYSKEASQQCEAIFISLLTILGQRHIKTGFDKAVMHLAGYNPRQVKELQSSEKTTSEQSSGVEPLVTFLELVNVGDLIQQMVDVFYMQELVSAKLTDRDDFLNPAAKEKKRFEQMLDERVAAGMSKGIDVLMDEVEFICATTQPATDFNPGADGTDMMMGGIMDIGPSKTATQIVQLVESHTSMLTGSTEKTMLDIFYQEVGLRLFGTLCKHIKRQRISVDGAIKLISDINLYASFASTLKQKPLIPYYTALRELSQIYLVDCSTPPPAAQAPTGKSSKSKSAKNTRAKELATIIADNERYKGIFGAEEVLEFAERRADWYAVKGDVERALYGIGCVVM